MKRIIVINTCLLNLLFASQLQAQEFCYYVDASGAFKQVIDKESAPEQFRAKVRCIVRPVVKKDLADPDEIEIDGNEGRRAISTPLGRVDLRWDRASQEYFGRSPQRAMVDAALAMSRMLKQGGFPREVENLNLDWKVVFMSGNIRSAQVPMHLISNCHPAWMTPPANIYVVADRVAKGCAGSAERSRKDADRLMAEILVHEIAHAVEARLLGPRMGGDSLRAEGFATWATSYAGRYSSLINERQLREEHLDLARRALNSGMSPWSFRGTAEGYALAAMLFYTLESRHRAYGIMQVYQRMKDKNLSFLAAAEDRYGWNRKKFIEEIDRLLKNG